MWYIKCAVCVINTCTEKLTTIEINNADVNSKSVQQVEENSPASILHKTAISKFEILF